MFFNPSSNYLQSAYYVAPQASHLQPFQEASCQAVCEKVISSNDDSQSAQQLQYDSDDLFFNHHELPSHHIEDSYFGSHISCDQIHDQDDDDLHGLFPIEFTQQISQQFSYLPPVQQSAPIASYLNESPANNKNIPVSYSNTQGMTYYQNNTNTNQMVYQKMSSSSSVVPSVPSSSSSTISTPQTYTFNNFKQQNNFYSSQQQQQQQQSYQQQQLGNNAGQMNQQFQNSSATSSSSTTFSSSQSCSTLFSSQQKQSVSYVAPSPVNYYKLYENNNLVNQQQLQQQQSQVKGNNGNNRQCLQPSQQQIMFSQGQSSKPSSSIMFQALNQQQSQTFSQQQQQQYQIPQFTQQYSYEEYSCGDHQASSILNFTENCGDETTSDMHLNDEHHTLPIYGYAPQQSNTCENFEFFGHSKEEDNQEEVYQQQQSQQQQVSYGQCQQDAKNYQMNNNIPSMSSSHTLPISPCEEPKHLSEDEEHESMEHHDHDDDDEEDDGKVVSMEIIADNPEFYTEARKEEITDAMQKSNKKNVVRNLMRAFKQYFLNRKTSEQIMKCFFPSQNGKDVQQKFKRYFSQRKFNHHSIKQLVQHEKYGAVFHQFLKEHSLAYLKNSSVKMQELHQVFIDFLLLCFKDIDLLDHLETYSKIKNPFQ